MLKAKLLNKARGIGKDSGRPWCRITISADKADGSRSVNDFFVAQDIATKIDSIPLDANIYVTADLDENLHFSISDVRSADKA